MILLGVYDRCTPILASEVSLTTVATAIPAYTLEALKQGILKFLFRKVLAQKTVDNRFTEVLFPIKFGF